MGLISRSVIPLLFLQTLSTFSSSRADEIILLQGEHRPLPKSSSIWVENGSIVRIDEGSKGEVLKGLKPGQSEIRLNGITSEVQVLSLDQERTRRRLKLVLEKTLQLKMQLQEGRVQIIGRLVRLSDMEAITNSCATSFCNFKMAAEISEGLFTQVEALMNQRLGQFSLPKMRLDRGEYLTVHVPLKSSLIKETQRALSAMGIQIETSTTAIELAPLVKVQITLAEVKRDYLLQYGMKWPNAYQAQILPNFSGITDAQFVSAQFWEHSGAGRVLASPNILCRSGKDAEFVAGGEFPIKIVNFRLQDVIWKKYGIVLKVSPLADYSGRMSISVETEVSSIDPSRTVDGVPGLFTNRVQTHFDLTKPRTIALSGLIKSEDSKSSEGWPTLGQIPILGALFSSKDFKENKSELVIFVRPEIISPDAMGDEPSLPTEIKPLATKDSYEHF